METRFEAYLDHLCSAFGHAHRSEGLRGYCRGLMLSLARKSAEPLAASIDSHAVQARHQSLHHFVAKSAWSDSPRIGEGRRLDFADDAALRFGTLLDHR